MKNKIEFSAGEMAKKLNSAIRNADSLLIVPPAATTRTPILGPLILQAIAEERGLSCEVLHLNLLLAGIIGLDLYESISYGQPYRLMGERLFARAAHGLPPLGRMTELCDKPRAAVFGHNCTLPEQAFENKFYRTEEFTLDIFYKVEEICMSFVKITAETIAARGYAIIGCSSNWEQNNCSFALLQRVKALSPKSITIIGGCNCEGEMAEGIANLCPHIDFIFSGESENAFSGFLDNFKKGILPKEKIISSSPVRDLDAFPPPVLESFQKQYDLFIPPDEAKNWIISYETSRGCWWGKCHFCGLNGKERACFRQKKTKNVITELEDFFRTYPGKVISVIDKVMPLSYKKELLPLLEEKKDFPLIGYEQRPDLSFCELLQMVKARIISIKPGIEALSDGLLQLMNKGVSAAQNILLLRHVRCLNMYMDWNLLWGFPGEELKHYEETLALIPLLRHLYPPTVMRHISLDRFSPYFNHPEKYKITNLRPWAAYNAVYPDKADVYTLAYRFIGDYSSPLLDHPELLYKMFEAINDWAEHWEKTYLVMQRVMGAYIISDNRKDPDKPMDFIVEEDRAVEIMGAGAFSDSENQRWAVEHGLAVVSGDTYVPLVTAPADLLIAFES